MTHTQIWSAVAGVTLGLVPLVFVIVVIRFAIPPAVPPQKDIWKDLL